MAAVHVLGELEKACCDSIAASVYQSRDSKYLIAVRRFRHPLSGCGIPRHVLDYLVSFLGEKMARQRCYELPAAELEFWLEAMNMACDLLNFSSIGLRAVLSDRLNERCLESFSLLRCVIIHGPAVTDSLAQRLSRLKLSAIVLSGSNSQDSSGRDMAGTITDSGMASLGMCTSLTLLSLRGANATDNGVSGLRTLTALTWLDLSNTRVGNRGVELLSRCEVGQVQNDREVAAEIDHVDYHPVPMPRLGLHSLKWLRLLGNAVTSRGATVAAANLPSLSCLEWGTPDKVVRCDGHGVMVASAGPSPIPDSRSIIQEELRGGAWVDASHKKGLASDTVIRPLDASSGNNAALESFRMLCGLIHCRLQHRPPRKCEVKGALLSTGAHDCEAGMVTFGRVLPRRGEVQSAAVRRFETRMGTVAFFTSQSGGASKKRKGWE